MPSVVKSEKSFPSAQSELGRAAEEEEPGLIFTAAEVRRSFSAKAVNSEVYFLKHKIVYSFCTASRVAFFYTVNDWWPLINVDVVCMPGFNFLFTK